MNFFEANGNSDTKTNLKCLTSWLKNTDIGIFKIVRKLLCRIIKYELILLFHPLYSAPAVEDKERIYHICKVNVFNYILA